MTALPKPRGAGLERELAGLPAGRLVRPGTVEYERARLVWNGRVNRRPALIAQCAGAPDVIASLDVARRYHLPITVRGSGHHVSGCAVSNGGLVVDLASMKNVRVDLERRVATVGAGTTWGELDKQTQMYGLATTGARVSTTGVVGVTLGGGCGWLMRKHGPAVDSLVGADLITADGEFLRVDSYRYPDLFWGLRGGGGILGVVTSVDLRLHDVGPTVTAGARMFPADRARELLCFFRSFMAAAPDDVSALLNLRSAPPPAPWVPTSMQATPVVVIVICHLGSADEARRDLAALDGLGTPLLDRVRVMPYLELQRLFDAAGHFGQLICSRSGHLRTLTDDCIDTLVAHSVGMTSPLSIVMISSRGGATARVDDHDTAFGHRQALFDYSINAVWTDPADARRHMEWTHKFGDAMRPYTSGYYINELDQECTGEVREAYTVDTYRRLMQLKAHYDPGNVFQTQLSAFRHPKPSADL